MNQLDSYITIFSLTQSNAINRESEPDAAHVRIRLEPDAARFHEVHDSGKLSRGYVGDVSYHQVIDENGKLSYMVLRRNQFVGMFAMSGSDDSWAIVDINKDAIIGKRNLKQFAIDAIGLETERFWAGYRVIPNLESEVIDYAHVEVRCPRWGC